MLALLIFLFLFLLLLPWGFIVVRQVGLVHVVRRFKIGAHNRGTCFCMRGMCQIVPMNRWQTLSFIKVLAGRFISLGRVLVIHSVPTHAHVSVESQVFIWHIKWYTFATLTKDTALFAANFS